jgi:hypothetical protein
MVDLGLKSACDTEEKETGRSHHPLTVNDEHDDGYTWGPPLHPVT